MINQTLKKGWIISCLIATIMLYEAQGIVRQDQKQQNLVQGDDTQDRYQMPGSENEEDDRSIGTETIKRYKSQLLKVEQINRAHNKTQRLSSQSKIIPRPNQENETVYVHLIAHTHDDVGWIKTLDQYYSGTNQDAQHATVHLILDSTIEELLKNKERKFTYVEMKFFKMWYDRQSEKIKKEVKMLVKEGRLEFANGGWSSTDEASANYEDMINNMIIGHKFLQSEFGITPKIGWNLDSFGHSSSNARLFADMGFEAQFFARMDRNDKAQRERDHAMEYIWRPFSKHFGTQKQILTSLFQDHYCWIPDFQVNDNDAFESDPTLESFNAEDKMVKFVNYIHTKMMPARRGNIFALPWGCDFAFYNARQNYADMENLIQYLNENSHVNMKVLMSTPQTYVDALKKQNVSYATYYNDMFPYSDEKNDYWSGIYTSRPTSKKLVKDGSANLHAANKLFAQKVLNNETKDDEIKDILKAKDSMFDAMSIYQHHDAISGTEAQFVADDYAFTLQNSIDLSNQQYKKILTDSLKRNTGIQSTEIASCIGSQNNTVIECPIYDNKNDQRSEFIVIGHNPSAQTFKKFLRVRLPNQKYKAQCWNKANQTFIDVEYDILEQKHITNARSELVDYEMYIQCQVEPNEISYAKIIKTEDVKEVAPLQDGQEGPISLAVEGVSPDGEVVFKYKNKEQNLAQRFGINMKYYQAQQSIDYRDKKEINGLSEGPYLFKPDKNSLTPLQYSTLDADVAFEHGNQIDQWTIRYNNATTQQAAVIKVRFSELFDEFIEYEVELSEIPIKDGLGKDVTINWKMFDDFDINKQFWTDANGLEMQERKINYNPRFPWPVADWQNVSSNYYPVDSAIAVKDTKKQRQVTILNDRAQGGSADLSKSTIELNQQRRLIQDDNKGVQEILNETDSQGIGIKVNAKYYMQIFDLNQGVSKQRQQQMSIDQPIQYFFAFDYSSPQKSSLSQKQDRYQQSSLVNMNGKVQPLQQGQNLAQSETNMTRVQTDNQMIYKAFPLKRNQILVRFENIADKFDSKTAYVNRLIDVKQFAKEFYAEANQIDTIDKLSLSKVPEITYQEVNLNGMTTVNKAEDEYKWKGDDDKVALAEQVNKKIDDKGDVKSFVPQSMRSFVITYQEGKGQLDLGEHADKQATMEVKEQQVVKNKIQQAQRIAQVPASQNSTTNATAPADESADPPAPVALDGTSGAIELVQIQN